jgi:hypothetical protein
MFDIPKEIKLSSAIYLTALSCFVTSIGITVAGSYVLLGRIDKYENEIRNQQKAFNTEVSILKNELATLRTEISALKTEPKKVKTSPIIEETLEEKKESTIDSIKNWFKK